MSVTTLKAMCFLYVPTKPNMVGGFNSSCFVLILGNGWVLWKLVETNNLLGRCIESSSRLVTPTGLGYLAWILYCGCFAMRLDYETGLRVLDIGLGIHLLPLLFWS